MPGGVEYGEPLEEAAARELYEETGLIAKELVFFRSFSGKQMLYTYPNADQVYVIEHLFVCKNDEGTTMAQVEEVEELKFLHWSKINDFTKISPLCRPGLKAYIDLKEKEQK